MASSSSSSSSSSLTPAASSAVAAWKRALQRCVRTKSHALVEQDEDDGSTVVLVFVDAPHVFHAAHALVADVRTEEQDDDDEEEEEEHAVPLVVVMKLHATVKTLLQDLVAAGVPTESIDAVVASLVFRDQATPIANRSTNDTALRARVPFFARRAVNVSGGALCVYGETQQRASQALTMVTLAITSSDDRLATELERLVVVVEHRDGYLARDFTVSDVSASSQEQSVSRPRLMTIQKREWDSGAIAQLSLDDALEAYEAAFNEEQEINGNVESEAAPRSLEISVHAAFDVREQPSGARASAFLMDMDDVAGSSTCTTGMPPVVLFSQWEGLENVRSLLCKPPPQSASTLCFSSEAPVNTATRLSAPRQSLTLLQHLERAVQDASVQHTWKSLPSESTTAEIVEGFKRFLRNIDHDGSAVVGDDTTNNTIESTISMALDGERQRTQSAVSRADMDPVEKLWDYLAREADGTQITLLLLQEFMIFLSTTRVFPAPHPDNDTALATLVRLRHDEIQGKTNTNFATAAQHALEQPVNAFACLIEAGEWKMKRDVAYSLAQAGFSSQECSEFVQAMPRYDLHTRIAAQVHWKAMDHILQLCASALSVHLPVSFMRKAVHECVAYHAHSGRTSRTVDPSILVDLQSFIPDRLRASIADALYWDMRIAFSTDFEHRVHICQDAFHPTAGKRSQSQALGTSKELVLDDATLRRLHRDTPEAVLLRSEMVQFMTKLEDDRERRLYEQLHDIDMPTGMTRYDCTVRRLQMFP